MTEGPHQQGFFYVKRWARFDGSVAICVNSLYCKKGIRRGLVPLQQHQRYNRDLFF